MIRFFLIVLLSMSVAAVDMEALKREKESFKIQRGLKKEKQSTRSAGEKHRVVIIFKKEYMPEMGIERKYDLTLQKCLVQKVCIFRNNTNASLDALREKMRTERGNIDTIENYKRYHFKRY